MPPAPQPQDPQDKNQKPAINPKDLLLPKKETPGMTTQSAQRVSAGVLLDQENKAGQEGIQNPSAPERTPTPVPSPKPAAEVSSVKPLETYQSDIESVMQGSNTSVVSIAAAEAQRRAQKGRDTAPLEPAVPLKDRLASFGKRFAMVAAGIVLVGVAAGVLAYFFLRPTTVPVVTSPTSPFISVDEAKAVTIKPDEPTRDIMNKLEASRESVSLSLGLMERIVPAVASSTPNGDVLNALSAQTFLSLIAPNIPASLLRTIEPNFLLGVHVYDANQPFLIVRVDSYQEAFSGMLAWEFYMQRNLSPLFDYVPSAHINNTPAPIVPTTAGTSTATSTASTTIVSSPIAQPPVVPDFIDKVVENHDARVLINPTGDIYLLWTFIDRNTLVITTNAATLREIISRLQNAPVTQTPGATQ